MAPYGYMTTGASTRSMLLGDREVYILPGANPFLVNPLRMVVGDVCLGPLRQFDPRCDEYGADFLPYARANRMDFVESQWYRYYIGYSARSLTLCGQYVALDLYIQHPSQVFSSYVYQHFLITDPLDPVQWYQAVNFQIVGMRAFPPDGAPMYVTNIPRARI